MNISVELKIREGKVSDYKNWNEGGIALWWLGQAGFLIRYNQTNIIIDAYLSDVLAEKYKGKEFPHIRMMNSPIELDELTNIDFFISTHAHSDHMDPGLIPILRENCPDCHFVVPEAVRDIAAGRGVPANRLTAMTAGDIFSLTSWIKMIAVPAAHEEIKTDERGNHYFLGIVFDFGDMVIYHPGDCLPYEDMNSWLDNYHIDLALMPVNGRREELSQQGIAGNFDFDQAFKILMDHDIKYMIPHHFGMFDFNTVERGNLEKAISRTVMRNRIIPADTGIIYNLVRIG